MFSRKDAHFLLLRNTVASLLRSKLIILLPLKAAYLQALKVKVNVEMWEVSLPLIQCSIKVNSPLYTLVVLTNSIVSYNKNMRRL